MKNIKKILQQNIEKTIEKVFKGKDIQQNNKTK